MRFQQLAPPDPLKEYVRYFWTLESPAAGGGPRTFRTIVDGCPGLLFQQSAAGLFRDQTQKELPRFLLYGQATRPGELSAVGPFQTIGAYFYPSALTSIFGLNATELTDSCVDLDLLATSAAESHLSDQLLHTGSVADQLALLSAYLLAKVRANRALLDEGIRQSLRQLVASGGSLSLPELQASLGMSERSFQRKFKQGVGISPKLFARICRFQVALQQLRTHRYDKLSDIAFENEYADQSHYIRAFQEFAGCSPQQYQRQSSEVVENFPELIR